MAKLRGQGIGNQGIDFVIPEYSDLSSRRIET